MPRQRRSALFLLLALLLGQWLVLVHQQDHVAPDADPACEICVQIRQLGTGLAAAPVLFAPDAALRQEALPALAVAAPRQARRRRQPIRGPPANRV